MVDADFHLTFAVRPRDVLGLLFHARGHHRRGISVYLQKDKVGTLIQLAERGVEKQESEFKFKREMNLSVMSVRIHVSSYAANI